MQSKRQDVLNIDGYIHICIVYLIQHTSLFTGNYALIKKKL